MTKSKKYRKKPRGYKRKLANAPQHVVYNRHEPRPDPTRPDPLQAARHRRLHLAYALSQIIKSRALRCPWLSRSSSRLSGCQVDSGRLSELYKSCMFLYKKPI